MATKSEDRMETDSGTRVDIGSKDNTGSINPIDLKKLQAGKLGVYFGTGHNATRNIAALIMIMLIIAGLILFLINHKYMSEFWTATMSIITLALGYLFGKGGQ